MDAATALPRVKKFLGPRFRFIKDLFLKHVVEPRDNRGKRRDHLALLHAIFAAFLAGCRTPRQAEKLSEYLYIPDRLRWGGKSGRISDTTLRDFALQLHWREFTPVLVEQIRAMNRKRELSPEGLPCGVVTVDGKHLGKLLHDAQGMALKQAPEEGEAFYYVRVLRAVLSSSYAKVCLGQEALGAPEGEVSGFQPFARWLWTTYGRHGLFDMFDVDAGFLSRENFEFVDQELGCGVVAALKGNQPDLYQEARRVLIPKWRSETPEAQTEWECYQGGQIRRRFYRSLEFDGYLGWTHLRQVWLVVQEAREKGALTQVEYEEELARQQRRARRKRGRLTEPRLRLPVLAPGQSPLSIESLAARLTSEPMAQGVENARTTSRKSRSSKADPGSGTPTPPAGSTMSSDSTVDAVPASIAHPAPAKPKRKHKRTKKGSRGGEVEERYLTEDGYLVTVELRFFITNLPKSTLSPEQSLLVVRNHWAVENDCFHSLDVQWKEDAPAWCSAGQALLSLGMLRLLAYNYTQQLRKRHVCIRGVKTQASRVRPWADLFELAKAALKMLFPAWGEAIPIHRFAPARSSPLQCRYEFSTN